MDGEFKYIHVAWIPAIPAGMTGFVILVYNDECRSVGTIFNPVKHKLVQRVVAWPYSSFHRYVRMEAYPVDWFGIEDESLDYER